MSFNKKPRTINPDEVDPSVYYYDEVYDDMKEEKSYHKKELNEGKTTRQGSKYIQGIVETADRRKSEREIRKFTKYARDREEAEANGELDKTDVYVSQSYEKKLREIKNSLKKESKTERDLEFNALKRHKRDVDKETSHLESRQAKSPHGIDADRANDSSPAESTSWDQHTTEPKQRPKTIKERREYLRNLLKKQTVGGAFEAAVQRYKQRKALAP